MHIQAKYRKVRMTIEGAYSIWKHVDSGRTDGQTDDGQLGGSGVKTKHKFHAWHYVTSVWLKKSDHGALESQSLRGSGMVESSTLTQCATKLHCACFKAIYTRSMTTGSHFVAVLDFQFSWQKLRLRLRCPVGIDKMRGNCASKTSTRTSIISLCLGLGIKSLPSKV